MRRELDDLDLVIYGPVPIVSIIGEKSGKVGVIITAKPEIEDPTKKRNEGEMSLKSPKKNIEDKREQKKQKNEVSDGQFQTTKEWKATNWKGTIEGTPKFNW